MKTFETIDNRTYIFPDGKSFTISAICEDSGSFEICIFGDDGLDSARAAVNVLDGILSGYCIGWNSLDVQNIQENGRVR